MTPDDLRAFINERQIEAEMVRLPAEVATVSAAAEALGVSPEQIGKSLLFAVKGEKPVLVVANGTTRLDPAALAQYLGVGRKRVRLASPDMVIETLGYPVGTVPPFGHGQPVRTILEAGVLAQEDLYVGGGGIMDLIHIRVKELRRILPGAEVVALAVD